MDARIRLAGGLYEYDALIDFHLDAHKRGVAASIEWVDVHDSIVTRRCKRQMIMSCPELDSQVEAVHYKQYNLMSAIRKGFNGF